MKHILLAATLITILQPVRAMEIPQRPGKVTKTIAIFPEQQVKYSMFQNFLHYWNDRPLYIDRTHRYPGNKFAYNTDASLFTDMQIARRYGISGGSGSGPGPGSGLGSGSGSGSGSGCREAMASTGGSKEEEVAD